MAWAGLKVEAMNEGHKQQNWFVSIAKLTYP